MLSRENDDQPKQDPPRTIILLSLLSVLSTWGGRCRFTHTYIHIYIHSSPSGHLRGHYGGLALRRGVLECLGMRAGGPDSLRLGIPLPQAKQINVVPPQVAHPAIARRERIR